MTAPKLLLEKLSVRNVRNLERVDAELAPRLNVVSGDNGHGKTSFLEAIYFVATSRSFRTSKTTELVRHGSDTASARARFVESSDEQPSIAREQTAASGARGVIVRVDGNRPESLAEYATRSPIVVFHPQEIALSMGPAAGRRTMLDRLALFRDPQSADHRARYARALRARQQLLRGSLPGGRERELEAFEVLAARHGAALTRSRAEAAASIAEELDRAFPRIAAPRLVLEARYKPGGSLDEAEARAELERSRSRDAHRPSASFGPHRDDLELTLDGHPARTVGSQGQHRAVTLALKAAETAAITLARGVEPILLLDDVSSELDPRRTEALFTFLSLTQGQIVLTTTRPELILATGVEPSDRRDFLLRDGALA